MKMTKIYLGAILAMGLAMSFGCEADVDTAASEPAEVNIENRYEYPDREIRYGAPERESEIRFESTENNYEIESETDLDDDDLGDDREVEFSEEREIEIDRD